MELLRGWPDFSLTECTPRCFFPGVSVASTSASAGGVKHAAVRRITGRTINCSAGAGSNRASQRFQQSGGTSTVKSVTTNVAIHHTQALGDSGILAENKVIVSAAATLLVVG